MFISLFTYDRPKMLEQTLNHLRDNTGLLTTINVFEDGVTFPYRGKKGFWVTWNEALKECDNYGLKKEIYLFMPEDFLDLDLDRLQEIHERLKDKPYVCNIINDGRHQQWMAFPKQEPVDGLERVGFTDCGFFCNREALEKIGFWMEEPPKGWFKQGEDISSGVGMMLTKRLAQAKIPIYKPVKSLAFHGSHPSKMHPNERDKNPLISK